MEKRTSEVIESFRNLKDKEELINFIDETHIFFKYKLRKLGACCVIV